MSATIIQFKRRVAPVRPVVDPPTSPLSAEAYNTILRVIEAEHQRRRALATKVPASAKPSRRHRSGAVDLSDDKPDIPA
jgi:hypothetical protein